MNVVERCGSVLCDDKSYRFGVLAHVFACRIGLSRCSILSRVNSSVIPICLSQLTFFLCGLFFSVGSFLNLLSDQCY